MPEDSNIELHSGIGVTEVHILSLRGVLPG